MLNCESLKLLLSLKWKNKTFCGLDCCFSDNTQVSVGHSDACCPTFSKLLLLLYLELADIHQVIKFGYSTKPIDRTQKNKHFYIPLR